MACLRTQPEPDGNGCAQTGRPGDLADRPLCLRRCRHVFHRGGNGPYYGVRWADPADPHSLHYLQGLLNSRLLDWFLHGISTPFRGGYWSYGKRFIEQLPIRAIDFTDKQDRACHEKMVALVEQMLQLHRDLAAAKTAHDKTLAERQIAATDKQIDRLVYALYGLTDAEIAVVEGSGAAA